MPLLTRLALTALTANEPTCAQVAKGATLTLTPGLSGSVKRQGENLDIQLAGKTYPLPTDNCDNAGAQSFAPLVIKDFNFDGVNDLAVLDGIGYGGVNLFYRLYFTEKASRTLRGSSSETVEMTNLTLDPVTKTLVFTGKSGPAYEQHVLCLLPGGRDYYTCRQTSLAENAQHPDDWDYTWLAPSGKALLTRPASRKDQPETFTVTRKAVFMGDPAHNPQAVM